MVPPYGYISRKIDVLQPYSHSVLTSVSCAPSLGCATYKWKLSRPAFLPVVFKLAIQMAAAESQDGVGSSNGPEHS